MLDGLRIVAALMVVFHHYVGFGGGTTASDSAWGRPTSEVFRHASGVGAYLWTGFCLFFIISGFVICMSSWGRGLGDFFKSRVMRLYPAYWFAVLVTTAVVTVWPVVRKPLDPYSVLANLTMVQEALHIEDVDSVYWTLWIELRFYLLFALVVWKGVTYRRVVAFCLLWVVAGLVTANVDVPALELFAMSQVAPFFVAGLAYYLMYRYRPNALLWGIVGFSWVLALRYTVSHQRELFHYLGRTLPVWPAELLVTLSYLVMAVVALGWVSRIQWRWLTVAGALTYPLYLLHETIGWTAIRLLRPGAQPWAVVAEVTAGMLVLAWLVHRLVERQAAPLLRRGIASAIEQLRAAEPAAAPRDTDPVVGPVVVPRADGDLVSSSPTGR